MREIKFRAWDKNFNEMADVLSIDFNTEDAYIKWKDGLQETRDFSEVELMQFTGLYDKNGTEIYEGDIVKVSTDNFREDTIHFIKYGIDQDYPAFDIEPCLDYAESNSLQYLMVWKDVYTIEIIGNIHDNPELLEKENK